MIKWPNDCKYLVYSTDNHDPMYMVLRMSLVITTNEFSGQNTSVWSHSERLYIT